MKRRNEEKHRQTDPQNTSKNRVESKNKQDENTRHKKYIKRSFVHRHLAGDLKEKGKEPQKKREENQKLHATYIHYNG